MRITPAALTAGEECPTDSVLRLFAGLARSPSRSEVFESFIGFRVFYDRPGRNQDYDVFPVSAVHVLSHARPAVLRLEGLLIAKLGEGAQVAANFENDIAAAAAVAARRSAHRNVFLAAEGDAAVSALTRCNYYCGLVRKPDHDCAFDPGESRLRRDASVRNAINIKPPSCRDGRGAALSTMRWAFEQDSSRSGSISLITDRFDSGEFPASIFVEIDLAVD